MSTAQSIIKTYQTEDLTVEVPFRGDAFFNATVVAKAFGKQPSDWLRSDETKTYIAAIRGNLGLEQNQLVIVKNGGNSPGTWLHPKLAVVFARWCNVDFAVWCDMQIDSILRGEVAALNKYRPSAAVVKALEAAAKMLNFAPSVQLGIVDKYLSRFEETAGLLPAYAVDAPLQLGGPAESSEATASATQLLKERNSSFQAKTLYRLMEKEGLLDRLTRPSTTQGTKEFWNVTQKGLEFGKNLSCPKNPRETQPHWYRSTFDILLKRLGADC